MLKFLDLQKFTRSLIPVTSADIFSKLNEFNQEGLFSEKIFGVLESSERRSTYSFIKLYTKVIHPAVVRILHRLNRKIDSFISTSEYFSLDSNGELINDPTNGVTGLSNFIEMFPKIKFRGGTSQRETLIKLLNDSCEKNLIFINAIPVIPPDFRPAYQDENNEWIVDSMNDIYQKILRQSMQLRSTGSSTGVLYDLLSYGMQLSIIEHDNFIRTKVEKKNGIIRSQMLGKRIDFSGRAVITPGPQLKVNEVGVPFRIACTLFEPFLIHKLIYSDTIDKEKLNREIKKYTGLELSLDSIRRLIKSIRNGDELPPQLMKMLWDSCESVMKDRVVICKRDPVLHAESVRGFKPILVKGTTIQLCTLQTGGFNADFDGDQMAIYHPLTNESQEEVKTRMMKLTSGESSNTLVFELSKEMYVGLYLITKNDKKENMPDILVKDEDLEKATNPYIPVIYRDIRTTMGKAIFNSCFPSDYPFIEEQANKKIIKKHILNISKIYDQEIIRNCVSKLSYLGFKFATIMSPTLTLDDIELPKEIYKLKEKLPELDTESAARLIKEMETILINSLKDTGIYELMASGAGKGWDQPTQMLIAKGIIADPKGRVLPTISGSFADGLSTIEFFDSARGSRKGLADRTLNTAATGYLSRKMAYLLNAVEVDYLLKDCKTDRTLTLKLDDDLISRLQGRYVVKNNKSIPIEEANVKPGDTIELRSPIFCKSEKICHTCYGKLIERHKSPFVGIVAAQIMGEKWTQLIMRTFHTGGAIKVKRKDVLRDIINNSINLEK